jgi:hypothetical protein
VPVIEDCSNSEPVFQKSPAEPRGHEIPEITRFHYALGAAYSVSPGQNPV